MITVNSGVGMESLLHLKTVISTGKSDYSCATTTIKTEEELEQILTCIPQPDEKLIKRFLYHYKINHLFKANEINKIRSLFLE